MHKRQASQRTEALPLLLTIPEVAATLGIGRRTVYHLIQQEGLPTVNMGRPGGRSKLRISVATLQHWISEREAPYPDLRMSAQTDAQRTKRLRGARKSLTERKRERILPLSQQRSSRSS